MLIALGCRTTEPAAPTVQTAPTRLPYTMLGDTGRIGWSVPSRSSQLSDEQLRAALPRVQRLRAQPDTIALGLGDSVFIPQHVRILALDADGVVVGELRHYDFGLQGGLAPLRSGAVRSSILGTARFTARWPRRLLPEGQVAPPAAELTVLVTAIAGVAVPEPSTARGMAVLTGVVRDEGGKPIPDARVSAYRGFETVAQVRAGDDGAYRLDSLSTGITRIVVVALGHTMQVREVELPATGERRLNVTMPTLTMPPTINHSRSPQ